MFGVVDQDSAQHAADLCRWCGPAEAALLSEMVKSLDSILLVECHTKRTRQFVTGDDTTAWLLLPDLRELHFFEAYLILRESTREARRLEGLEEELSGMSGWMDGWKGIDVTSYERPSASHNAAHQLGGQTATSTHMATLTPLSLSFPAINSNELSYHNS
ncbi:hypothetical protein EJ06DRAFT_527783 [Trichodelitschia bisporula]|uniref:Uncharacterized protein n=1 Tax=Trichodelitschia bisporula TaxID=703511 RepID=A0A6G1I499_9PEZI|nr:hypothetical protein EJ06DRAFT_527783 [Trichodelitschia bisporula]